MRKIELLAPAKNLECGIAAIDHGADAVYIGAAKFGARSAAGNSIEDIATLCEYAHKFGAKVYVTVNTIIFESELEDTIGLVEELHKISVDAILLQDMGMVKLIREKHIPIEMHASTQTDNRTSAKVEWLRNIGFSRVVLARELSKDEIAQIHRDVPNVELEVFVHGALCVSYSGVCYASQSCFGRSANRGDCAQFCRLKFDLMDSQGKTIEENKHFLSLKDMCQIDHLEELAEAGATSFKIEGRLKSVDYVKNVVASYSKKINEIIAKNKGKYERASVGNVEYTFDPNLHKTFNRGYTSYFFNGRTQSIVNFDTPKALGEYVGVVKDIQSKFFIVSGISSFSNGDGLCFLNSRQQLEGFRINKVEGNKLFPLKVPATLKKGMKVYRNNDESFQKKLMGKTAVRQIPIKMIFRLVEKGFELEVLELTCLHRSYKQLLEIEHIKAQKPQKDNIIRQLIKLGGSNCLCEDLIFENCSDEYFIPSSVLTELRRNVIEGFLAQPVKIIHHDDVGNVEQTQASSWHREYQKFPYIYNIANKSAQKFYQEHGIAQPSVAFEVKNPPAALLMQCRHCIRYSMGYCVKRGGMKPSWKEPLFLKLGNGRKFRLEFNCNECQMNVYEDNV